jgi:hypothetical protein
MIDLKRFFRPSSISGVAILGLGVGLALSACTTSSTPSAAGRPSARSSASATRSAAGPTATATSVAPTAPISSAPPAAPTAAASPSAAAKLVPLEWGAGGEFLSPSNNISCEVDYHRSGITGAYCETFSPPESVKMGVTGTYAVCKGQMCQSNPGEDTPTLAYGTATGAGPFRCTSATTGVTCLAHGKGFHISNAGITPASG